MIHFSRSKARLICLLLSGLSFFWAVSLLWKVLDCMAEKGDNQDAGLRLPFEVGVSPASDVPR